jgi:hypothetical protein
MTKFKSRNNLFPVFLSHPTALKSSRVRPEWKLIVKSLRIGYGREKRKAGTGRSLSRTTEEVPLSTTLLPARNPIYPGEG